MTRPRTQVIIFAVVTLLAAAALAVASAMGDGFKDYREQQTTSTSP